MIYLDNAGTTKVSDSVLKAMFPYFGEIYGNASSLHDIGQIAKEHLESAREKVAKLLGALPQEIFFTSGGSESENLGRLMAKNILFRPRLNITQF